MNQDGKRLHALDALRGVAASSVVLFHYSSKYEESYGHVEALDVRFPLGHYGVALFFVISGFVIFMTLERTSRTRDFVFGRFSRLFPTYWTCVLLTFAGMSFGVTPDRATTLPQAFVNLTMVQEFLGVPHVDGVYWTLECELVFYTILATLAASSGLRRCRSFSCAWLTVILLGALAKRAGVAVPHRVELVLLLDPGPLFVAGMMLYRIHRDGFSWRTGVVLGCAWAVYALGHDAVSTAVAAALFALVAVVVLARLPLPLVLARFGRTSYALYLIHQNLGYVVIRTLERRGWSPDASVAVAVALAVGTATLITRFVERPAVSALRRWWKRDARVVAMRPPAPAPV